ncbi:Arm DNA-binding domain-containing protein [Parasutterella muris]|uniref:Arm DNA-binding domain-containing protein n=1 Tax=Parasutterella muris TaxID=2565572 RepID=UPI002040809A|nr:Arm DNA-binding domain-containing protein [Parasutterella muris]
MAKVTAKNIFSLPDGRHTVAPNLMLRVRGNSRTYVMRYSIGGKRKDKNLGSASELSISEARAQAELFRAGLQEGVLPITPREVLAEKVNRDSSPTFEKYSIKTIDKIAAVRMWKNDKHRYQWLSFPEIG